MRVHSTQDARLAEKTTSHSLAVVVLAAGKGKRLRSSVPKVLHPVAGRPLLWHVLQTARVARPSKIVIVVGHGADDVREAVSSWGITPKPVFVEQAEQLGTGHAVLEAERAVGRAAEVLVANGDFDPVRPEDVRALLRTHRRTKSAVSVLTAEMDEPGGYGRVIREGDRLVAIREPADATPAELRIREGATNWIVFRRADLYRALPLVGRDNRQREDYLKDVVRDPARQGGAGLGRARRHRRHDRRELARGPRGAGARRARPHQRRAHGAGVTLARPGHHLHRRRRHDRRRHRDPPAHVPHGRHDGRAAGAGRARRRGWSTPGRRRCRVEFAVAEARADRRDVDVGPFARLRPGTVLARRRVRGHVRRDQGLRGRRGTKVPHLTYVGDATVGRRREPRGRDRHRRTTTDTTSIGPRSGTMSRIGSDTMLVAPVKVGKRRGHRGRFGDHEGRAGRLARGRARRAADREGVPRAQGRADAPRERMKGARWRSSPRSG